MRRAVSILAVTAGALALAFPAVASAASWGPISSYYNGSKVVSGSGDFTGGTRVASGTITVTDSKNDGNAVYGKTRFEYKYYNTAQAAYVWTNWYTLSIAEFSNTTKTASSGSRDSQGPGLGTRGRSQVCAQMGWPVPDSCAST